MPLFVFEHRVIRTHQLIEAATVDEATGRLDALTRGDQGSWKLIVHPTYHSDTAQYQIVKLIRRLVRSGQSIEGLQQCLREVADEYND